MTAWYHLDCIFTAQKRARSTTKKITCSADLDGFDDLKTVDQQLVEAAIAAGTGAAAPAKKAKAAPAKKAKPVSSDDDGDGTDEFDDSDSDSDAGPPVVKWFVTTTIVRLVVLTQLCVSWTGFGPETRRPAPKTCGSSTLRRLPR